MDELQLQSKMDMEIPKYDNLIQQFDFAIELVDDIVLKNYISKLEDMKILTLDQDDSLEKNINNIRMFKINKIVYSKEEDTTFKLVNVLNAVGINDSSIFIIMDSDGSKTDFYMGIHSMDETKSPKTSFDILSKSMQGHFPGINLKEQMSEDISELLSNNEKKAISSVTGVANFKDENSQDNETFIQGLEKLALSMSGIQYTGVILASPSKLSELKEVRRQYEDIYTKISTFENIQLSHGKNQTVNEGSSITDGTTFSENKSENISTSVTIGTTDTTNDSKSISAPTRAGKNANTAMLAMTIGGSAVGAVIGTVVAPGAGTGVGAMVGSTVGSTVGNVYAMSKQGNISETTGGSQSTSESKANTSGDSWGTTSGTSQSETKNTGLSYGDTDNLQVTTQNKMIQNHMKRIENQLERLEEAESIGMWQSAAYFLADQPYASEIAAANYKSIMQGKDTGVEISSISSWTQDHSESRELRKYIKQLKHPIFIYENDGLEIPVTPTSFVSGKELAIQMGLPRKSVPGFPVVNHSQFGLEVTKNDNSKENAISIGNVFHMGHNLEERIKLDLESLSMHTFITGSTGSGKSNAIYTILDQLRQNDVNFLIIEPAKGEYKTVFGGEPDVTVLGTNPNTDNLLKINPFAFPEDIHVLEHADRLIEIFNVCWPMYAAMPAILKEAVIKSYEEKGWNLDLSINLYASDDNKFPTFQNLLKNLESIIDITDYGEEQKGNYKGSLVTRVKSLTNGLYNHIFCEQEIDSEILFDSNVIVDLSRIGSSESKSLIMGILVMRLNEYRMCQSESGNENLKHVTVLEEAHNILKRTSTDQASEGSNMIGKSVEMLSNSIAEMRTYGEGFIIADQSPNMLDASAIRNTNTKIILRMSDEEDRNLVGKAAGLDDSQIEEILKFPRGVAAVYQNDWLEPVLCKFDKYNYEPVITKKNDIKTKNITGVIDYLLRNQRRIKRKMNTTSFLSYVKKLDIEGSIKNDIVNFTELEQSNTVLENKEETQSIIASLIKSSQEDLRKIKEIVDKQLFEDSEVIAIDNILEDYITHNVNNLDQESILFIKESILKHHKNLEGIYEQWKSLIQKGVLK